MSPREDVGELRASPRRAGRRRRRRANSDERISPARSVDAHVVGGRRASRDEAVAVARDRQHVAVAREEAQRDQAARRRRSRPAARARAATGRAAARRGSVRRNCIAAASSTPARASRLPIVSPRCDALLAPVAVVGVADARRAPAAAASRTTRCVGDRVERRVGRDAERGDARKRTARATASHWPGDSACATARMRERTRCARIADLCAIT